MLKIRLTRVGKKNSPAYRVVVADKKRAVKGKFIEIIGNYNPTLQPKTLVINKERALFWLGSGAQPSDTVNNLMVNLGILEETKTIKKIYGKKFSKKAIKSGADKVVETPAEETVIPEKQEETPQSPKIPLDTETTAEVPAEQTEEAPAAEVPAEKTEEVVEAPAEVDASPEEASSSDSETEVTVEQEESPAEEAKS